jgi:hypothetical protein
MYEITLVLHSLLRWLVLVCAAVALFQAYSGWFGKKSWSDSDRRWNVMFAHSMTLQFVIGLLLYAVLSPITTQGVFPSFGAAMKDRILRFWGVEHIFAMTVALALAHIGNARARKALTDEAKHKAAAIFFTIAILLVLASIPWSFLSYGRPLFRFS